MKKLASVILATIVLMMTLPVLANLISKPFTFQNGPGNFVDATKLNADWDALYTLVNGNIDSNNISPLLGVNAFLITPGTGVTSSVFGSTVPNPTQGFFFGGYGVGLTPLTVFGMSGQTADIQDWRAGGQSGLVQTFIDKNGAFNSALAPILSGGVNVTGGGANITGNTTVTGNASVSGSATVGSLVDNGTARVSGLLTALGGISATGTVAVSGPVAITGNLSATGGASLSGAITGNPNFSGSGSFSNAFATNSGLAPSYTASGSLITASTQHFVSGQTTVSISAAGSGAGGTFGITEVTLNGSSAYSSINSFSGGAAVVSLTGCLNNVLLGAQIAPIASNVVGVEVLGYAGNTCLGATVTVNWFTFGN
jgi:hypothetical protein